MRLTVFKFAMVLMLALVSILNVMAQDNGTNASSQATLSIVGVSNSTDGLYNFKNFSIEAPQSGAYYTEFWLLPAKLANNRYSTFNVYVNDVLVGSISATSGNWQSARVDGHERLNLNAGTNVISIATSAPEFPDVENIKVALNSYDASFSSDSFEEYLEDAMAGSSYETTDNSQSNSPRRVNSSNETVHFVNVPLLYTFYKTFSFTKDQVIFITTSSYSSHKIDIIYFGSPSQLIIDPIIPIDPNSSSNNVIGNNQTTGGNGFNLKPDHIYTPATSQEMQGLNWLFPSQKTLNSSIQVASARITIPKTGLYLVRVRHADNYTTGVADVNINGDYYYEDAPISYVYNPCYLPSDGEEHNVFTMCANPGVDDPFIFIHGAAGDRVVGFNDDAPSNMVAYHGLDDWDSYISQVYSIHTDGISVNSYSSNNPISHCDIYALVPEYIIDRDVDNISISDKNLSTSKEINSALVDVVSPSDTYGDFSIRANESIKNIIVSDFSGNIVGSVSDVNRSSIVVPASFVNIKEPGGYFLQIETVSGMATKKFILK